MRNVRLLRVNVVLVASRLFQLGYKVGVSRKAKTGWNCGCSDRNCCPQHDARYRPWKWASISTDAPRRVVDVVFEDLRAGKLGIMEKDPMTMCPSGGGCQSLYGSKDCNGFREGSIGCCWHSEK